MRMSKLLTAVLASSLFATPVLANTAAPLSLANASSVKASTSAKKSNKLTAGLLVGVLSASAVVAGVIAAAQNSDSN